MKITYFDQLPAQEQDAFQRACARRQRSAFEFRVQAEHPNIRIGDASVSRKIFVMEVSTWFGKHYPADAGIGWTAAFERDLMLGTFN
jgi:hypothetical protein